MSDFNDILNSIRNIALEHEEPYKDGSWENFLKRKEKKKTFILWPILISGLAACLVIGIFIIPQMFDKYSTNDNFSNRVSKIEPSEMISGADTAINEIIAINQKIEPQQIENRDIQHEKNIICSTTQNERTRHQVDFEKDRNETQISEKYKGGKQIFKQDDSVMVASKDSIMKSKLYDEITKSLNESFESEIPEPNKTERLIFGFSISPLLASNENGSNLGMSTGVQTDIPLSRKISINSGFTLARQKVVSIYDNRASFNDPTSLTSRLFSFDIPINLKIALTKRKNKETYILAGISSVGYLSEHNTYTYEYEEVMEITTTSGGQEITTFQTIVTEKDVEHSEPAFSSFDFAGFMNFSYGYKSAFSKNAHLTLAPYIKLPLSGLTSNNLKYTSGGISLIISK